MPFQRRSIGLLAVFLAGGVFAEPWKEFIDQKTTFFSAMDAAGELEVLSRGTKVPLKSLSPREIQSVRLELESLWVADPAKAGGDESIRNMLRAIRYRLGPNLSPAMAHTWTMRAVIVPEIKVEWKDVDGTQKVFHAKVKDISRWEKDVRREMEYLSDLVFVRSWGKILLKGEVRTSKRIIDKLMPHTDKSDPSAPVVRYLVEPAQVKKLIDDTFPGEASRSCMIWVPEDGTGDVPPWVGPAYTGSDKPTLDGEIITAVHTTDQRLSRPHGWAKKDAGGLVHEFWHHIQNWLADETKFSGFVVDNHDDAHRLRMEAEIKAQKLPMPFLSYAEYLGALPTESMLEAANLRP